MKIKWLNRLFAVLALATLLFAPWKETFKFDTTYQKQVSSMVLVSHRPIWYAPMRTNSTVELQTGRLIIYWVAIAFGYFATRQMITVPPKPE